MKTLFPPLFLLGLWWNIWYNKVMQAKPTSAYVHIPFCTQICYYCDFSKVFIKNQPVDAYLEHLIQEFRSYDIGKTAYPLLVVDTDSSICLATGGIS